MLLPRNEVAQIDELIAASHIAATSSVESWTAR